MINNYKTKAAAKPKSRSEQRRQAVQRGEKLPTFAGVKIKNSASEPDPHVHISPAAQNALTKMVKAEKSRTNKKVSRKDLASAAILDYAKQPR